MTKEDRQQKKQQKRSAKEEKRQQKISAKEERKKYSKSLRISTRIIIVLLPVAAAIGGYMYYDLMLRPLSPEALSSAEEAAEKEAEEAAEAAEEAAALADFSDKTDTVIIDGDTAMQALSEIEYELGIEDVWSEYDVISESVDELSGVYRMQQYYDGIKVWGHTLKVIADSYGSLISVSGEYAEIGDITSSYSLNSDDAVQKAENYLVSTYGCTTDKISFGDAEKVIYADSGDGGEGAVIAYEVTASVEDVGVLTILVNGITGEIINTFTTEKDAFMTTGELTGQSTGLFSSGEAKELDYLLDDDGTIILADTERNIYIYDYDYMEQYVWTDSSNVPSYSLKYNDGSADEDTVQSGVDALYNMQRAYDYYLNVLGREGVSGSYDNSIVITVEYHSSLLQYDNAAMRGITDGATYFAVMPNSILYTTTMSYYLDVMAHELTHGVVDWESALGNYIDEDHAQTSIEYAINEGIADVMAEMADDYCDDGQMNGSNDWVISPDLRNISDAESWSSSLKTHVSDFKEGSTDCHYGSGIVSYPAYLMNEGLDGYDLLSTTQISKLYYRTIQYLNEYSDFEDFRKNIDMAASLMNWAGQLSDAELETVLDAMDYSGIEPTLSRYKVEKEGSLTIYDINGDEYEDYAITITRAYSGEVVVDNEKPGDATFQLPSGLAAGYYKVVLTDLENTDLTESFYILVNDNCEMNKKWIEAYASNQDVDTQFGSQVREVVLVLDTSGSMGGTPISSTRSSAISFVNTVMEETGAAKFSIVTYADSASLEISSSSDESALRSCINGIDANGSTNMYAGLLTAQGLLGESEAEDRIIVIMSDGLPNEGMSEGGDYEAPLVSLASEIKSDGVTIYALGFFSDLSGDDLSGAISLMKSIATSGYYYNVAEDGLSDAFAQMASLVNGDRYVNVTMECPVEVAVTYDGETLSSSENYGVTRTSFGYITFEGEEGTDQAKVMRLLVGPDYEICIYGTDDGTMDYEISFPDDSGEYTDTRTFEDVPITEDTLVMTGTDRTSDTELAVDTDGDGSVDLTYRAGKNEDAVRLYAVFLKYAVIVLIAAAVIFAAVKIILLVRRLKKGRVCRGCGSILAKDKKFCPVCGTKVRKMDSFLPVKKERKPQRKAAKAVKGVSVFIFAILIAAELLLYSWTPTGIYNQIRDNKLVSAVWMYEGDTEDSAFGKAWLSLLLDGYLDKVEDGYLQGYVSTDYASAIYETVESMNLGGTSEKAAEYLTFDTAQDGEQEEVQ